MTTNASANLSVQQLRQAVVIREQIDALERELEGLLRGARTKASTGKSQMSAAGRERIAAAQRLRWAKVRGSQTTVGSANISAKRKRELSPAARAKIAAAQRQRWAKTKRTA